MAVGATPEIHYKVTLGSRLLSSRPQESQGQLIELESTLDMDGVGGHCRMTIGDIATDPPTQGDPLTLDLDLGQGTVRCFTGKVEVVGAESRSVWVEATDGLSGLARLEHESAYEDVNAGTVVKDLIAGAGLSPGTVVDGIDLAAYVVHRTPRALVQVERLAELCGADLYTDGHGKVHFATPDRRGRIHRLRYGADILDIDLTRLTPPYDSLEVWGEGAASSQGADKYHWLTNDLSGVCAKAALQPDGSVQTGSLGKRPKRIVSGAVRSGAVAAAVARAGMESLAARSLTGRMAIRAAPGVMPGDAVEITALPEGHAIGALIGTRSPLRVRSVRHVLSRSRGLVTRLGF